MQGKVCCRRKRQQARAAAQAILLTKNQVLPGIHDKQKLLKYVQYEFYRSGDVVVSDFLLYQMPCKAGMSGAILITNVSRNDGATS
jgi:hypothetical protein